MSGFMRHGLGDCTAERHCGCLAGAPTDRTAAIAEAARKYVAAIRAHEGAWPSLKTKLAVWDTKEALIAAVDAESADREPGCTCVRCAPNYHLMRGCPTCRNKRCPKVSDHDNRCTGSNEPGQIPERAASPETGLGATNVPDWHPNPNPAPNGPQNAETEQRP